MNINEPLKQDIRETNSEHKSSLLLGIYLSILAFSLILLLIFIDMSLGIQQIIVIMIGLLILTSFSAFQRIIEPQAKESLFNKYQPYFDQRVITYNTKYENSYYNQKQNLADAAVEIQQLLERLSVNYYNSSPEEIKNIIIEEVKLLETIENIENQRNEQLTDKEKVIVAQAVEEIENNIPLKQSLISALKAGGIAVFHKLIPHPLTSFVLASFEACEASKSECYKQ